MIQIFNPRGHQDDAFFLERTLRNTVYPPIIPAETTRAISETGTGDEVSKGNGPDVP